MRILQNRWYNFLVDRLSLDRSLFQLWLPTAPIEATDAALWRAENVIPPASLTFHRGHRAVARFSDQYAAVRSQTEAPTGSIAQAIGGSNAEAWTAHLSTLDRHPAATELPALFQNWSARRAIGAMSAQVARLSRAASEKIGSPPAHGAAATGLPYRGGYADLRNLLNASPGASAIFDSTAVSAEVSRAWADGADSGVVGLWEASESAPLHRKFAASRVTANIAIAARAQWAVIPSDWYQSSTLATAFSSAASPPWRRDANPNWSDLFAMDGSLRRAPASLIVVDGLDIAVTSDGEYTPDEQRLIREHAPEGLWPLYAPATGAVDAAVRFGASNNLSMRISTRRDHPIILGANVLGIARYLGRAG